MLNALKKWYIQDGELWHADCFSATIYSQWVLFYVYGIKGVFALLWINSNINACKIRSNIAFQCKIFKQVLNVLKCKRIVPWCKLHFGHNSFLAVSLVCIQVVFALYMFIFITVYSYMVYLAHVKVSCGEFFLLFLVVKSLLWLLWDSSGLSTNGVVAFWRSFEIHAERSVVDDLLQMTIIYLDLSLICLWYKSGWNYKGHFQNPRVQMYWDFGTGLYSTCLSERISVDDRSDL